MEFSAAKSKLTRFNVSWSSSLLKKVDRYIELTGNTRSNFLAEAAKAFIEQESTKMLTKQSFLDQATAGELIEQLAVIVDKHDDPIWTSRTISFIAAIVRPLVLLRDKKYEPLTLARIIHYLDYDNIGKLIERFENDSSFGEEKLVISPLKAYLLTLPDYDSKLPLSEQSDKTKENFEYITILLHSILSTAHRQA